HRVAFGSRIFRLQRQNTADRSPIPGKDGGWRRGAPEGRRPVLGRQQGSQMQQSSRPPPHGGWVWRPRRVGDVRNGSLPVAVRLAQRLPSLLPTVKAVVS